MPAERTAQMTKPIICGICEVTLTAETGCKHFAPLGQDETYAHRRLLAEIAAAGERGWEIADRALAESA